MGGDRRTVASVAVTFGAFALPAAMLGVLWPDVRAEFDQSLGALGIVSLTYGLARMAPATTGRPLARRLGLGRSFALALLLLAAACAALSLAPSWPVFLVGVAGVGLASGGLDSLGATFIAAREQVGSAGVIHGSYGVGATVGPLAVAALPGWRLPVVLCLVVALVAIGFARWAREGWPAIDAEDEVDDVGTPPWRPVAWSLLAFAAFVAVEVTTGQWAYTWLTDVRDLADGAAATAVSAYWAGTTIGRLALSRPTLSGVVHRHGLAPFAGLAVLALAGLVLLPAGVSVVLLGLFGLAVSPIVPSLFATTAARVGRTHATRVAGWQLLATNVGGIGVPALTGLLVDRIAPGIIPTVMGVALVGVGLPALVALRPGSSTPA